MLYVIAAIVEIDWIFCMHLNVARKFYSKPSMREHSSFVFDFYQAAWKIQ